MKTFLTPQLLQSKGIVNSAGGALKSVLKPKNADNAISTLKNLKMPKPVSADAFKKAVKSSVTADAFENAINYFKNITLKKPSVSPDLLGKIAKSLKK